jgi:hypothetical protein
MEVGRGMLGVIVIFLDDIGADITVYVGESSCGVDEVWRMGRTYSGGFTLFAGG